jgi:hypothetical protein
MTLQQFNLINITLRELPSSLQRANTIQLLHVLLPGWDYINSGEATAGEVMSAAGYHTAHYGKW